MGSVGVVIVVGVDAVAEADAKITHVLYDGESISAVYRQKELFRRRDHKLWGSRYGVFRWGVETTKVQDSGKVDMSSQRQFWVAVIVQDMYRLSCVKTVL